MSNQSKRQASVRLVTSTASTYEGDFHALFDLESIAPGTFNGRLLDYINLKLGAAHTELNGAMAAFAIANGSASWNELGTFDAALEV